MQSTSYVIGLIIKDKDHTFSELSVSSKIKPKGECSMLPLKSQPEDPKSLCAVSSSGKISAITKEVNKLKRKVNISIKNVENNFF